MPALSKGRTKVVVLGSHGGQQITRLTGSHLRCGTSLAIEVDGEVTVVDCGCGSVHRLVEAGYDADQVRTVLITHCHADHVAELGSLVGFAWSSGRNGADPDRRLDVHGPTGIADYEAGTKLALRRSIADQEGPLAQVPTFDAFAAWHEIVPPREPVTLIDRPELSVRAVRVQHGAMPSLGFRVATSDVDVAISGDRGAGRDGFAAFAAGADAIVHEVIDRPLVRGVLEGQGTAPSFIDHLVDDHTDAPDVGRVATEAGVALLVLYHLIPANPGIDDQRWIDLVRPTYDGEIVVAHDLQVL
ncbi:MAG: MBL fold metallo-hydrolase [Acidimicrobiales bacterium]|nr:MBL fold metallo-hydrolase [Acidimicrobiales bacterium]HRW36222.1 MBL fold metallo-hydrolase [Aquihabitans sp.]